MNVYTSPQQPGLATLEQMQRCYDQPYEDFMPRTQFPETYLDIAPVDLQTIYTLARRYHNISVDDLSAGSLAMAAAMDMELWQRPGASGRVDDLFEERYQRMLRPGSGALEHLDGFRAAHEMVSRGMSGNHEKLAIAYDIVAEDKMWEQRLVHKEWYNWEEERDFRTDIAVGITTLIAHTQAFLVDHNFEVAEDIAPNYEQLLQSAEERLAYCPLEAPKLYDFIKGIYASLRDKTDDDLESATRSFLDRLAVHVTHEDPAVRDAAAHALADIRDYEVDATGKATRATKRRINRALLTNFARGGCGSSQAHDRLASGTMFDTEALFGVAMITHRVEHPGQFINQ